MGTGIPNNKVYCRGPCMRTTLTSQERPLLLNWLWIAFGCQRKVVSDVSECSRPRTGNQAGVDMCRAVPDATETTVGHNGTWEGCILQRIQPSIISQAGGVRASGHVPSTTVPTPSHRAVIIQVADRLDESWQACDHHHLCSAEET
jgi:hypothetical protein